jgi:thiamine-phosphate pyrophosphorylase
MGFVPPTVYPILDSASIPKLGRVAYLDRLGQSLADAGVWLLEYRNKTATDSEVLADARLLRAAMPWTALVLDDRVDVAMAAGFDGVHVDSGDLPPADARSLMGQEATIGTSASSEVEFDQALAALDGLRGRVDYIAFGPIFPTTTKQTSAKPIGIEGVRRFRERAGPIPKLVAAAGITLKSAQAVLEAGADCVAVSAAIFRAPDPAAEFRRWIQVLGDRER